MKREYKISFCLFIAAALVVCLIRRNQYDEVGDTKINSHSPTEIENSPNQEKAPVQVINSKSIASPKAKLSADEQKIIVELGSKLESALQATEKENAETAFEFEGANQSTVAIRVVPFNTDQTRQAYLAALNLVKGAPDKLQSFVKETNQKILTEYTAFKKPYKILTLSASPTGSDVVFVEKFVSNPQDGLPDRSGILTFKAADGYKMDNVWGGEDSWAFRRYRHLFEIGNDSKK